MSPPDPLADDDVDGAPPAPVEPLGPVDPEAPDPESNEEFVLVALQPTTTPKAMRVSAAARMKSSRRAV
jgi:hypothetical protein